MAYNNPFLDTYRNYVNKGWYGNVISHPSLSRWCENFKQVDESQPFDPKMCAHFLLNALIFYQEKQLKAIILSIEDKIKCQINQTFEKKLKRRLSESELKEYCDEYKSKSCVIAAAKPDAVGDSAHQASRMWRNTIGIETKAVSELKNVITENGKTHIFFVDDFVGTGTKMNSFLTDELFADATLYGFKNVNSIINEYKDSVDFNIAVFALHEKGYNLLSEHISTLNFYYGDMYNDEYDLLSDRCTLFDSFPNDKDNIINYLKTMQNKLDSNNPYALNLPISFYHGCPNNSLSLYYKSNSEWYGLLSESHPTAI